jgi:hypothetical protein
MAQFLMLFNKSSEDLRLAFLTLGIVRISMTA